MALLVQKFGGTSLATLKHINHAADIIAKAKQAGHDLVVIVSAMSGETDRLIALAQEMSANPEPREYAALVATGEQVSMALMAMALLDRGIQAKSYTGAQAGIQTCSQYKKARIQGIDSRAIMKDIGEGRVVVIAGFQGVNASGDITTLGRGGSDTTAVAVAAALKADECQIYTDVDGVYTTDPYIVSHAKRLDRITFEEMLELASLGAKVLQIRAVEFAGKYHIPLRVLSTFTEGPGTLITYENGEFMESPIITGIAYSRKEAKICITGIPDAPGLASKILQDLNNLNINIDMLVQHTADNGFSSFSFTVPEDEYTAALNQVKEFVIAMGAEKVTGMPNLAKLSLVGSGLKSHPEIAPLMFKTLASKAINIELIATSEIKISVLINNQFLDEGIRAIHQEFNLHENVFEEAPTFTNYAKVLAVGK